MDLLAYMDRLPLMLLHLLFIAASIFSAPDLQAGRADKPASLRGTLSAADLLAPLGGARIQISGSARVAWAATDMDGHYYVEVPAGDYAVRFVAAGFEDLSLTVRVQPGQARRLNAQLIRANMMAEPVVVRATRSGIPAELTAHMNIPLTPTPTAAEKKWAPVAKVVDRTFMIGVWALILLGAFGITKI